MRPIPRVLAILQDGPFDGTRFSVALSEGEPQALNFNGPDGEHVAYWPEEKLDLAEEHSLSLENQRQERFNEIHPVFQGFELYDPENDGLTGHHFLEVWKYKLNV